MKFMGKRNLDVNFNTIVLRSTFRQRNYNFSIAESVIKAKINYTTTGIFDVRVNCWLVVYFKSNCPLVGPEVCVEVWKIVCPRDIN